MRRFAGDESIDSLLRHARDLPARAPSNYSHAAHNFGTMRNFLYRSVESFAEPGRQFRKGNCNRCAPAKQRSFLGEKRLRGFNSDCAHQQNIVADFGMRIEREMRTVDGEVVVERDSELPVK